jgi:hypothetical protein
VLSADYPKAPGGQARGRRGLGQETSARVDTSEAYLTNLLEQAISCDDGDRAARLIQDALGIESDDVAKHCFPKVWPEDRELRARIIGEWLQTEARYLA